MIKPVDEIPKSLQEKRRVQREMIRKDITEAIEQGINRFEFDGDYYNYKYLANYARGEADYVWRKTAIPIRKPIGDRYKAEYGLRYFSTYPNYRDKRKYIRISSHKGEDRIHVYCEIFPDFLKEYEKQVEEEAKRDLEQQKKRDAERAERLKGVKNDGEHSNVITSQL